LQKVKFEGVFGAKSGFTLIELLTVMFIITILIGISLPVISKVRQHARSVTGMNNHHQVAGGVSCYAVDNDEKYPESVATIGSGSNWNWQEPTVITSIESRAPHLHRAMSEYLKNYIGNASTMFCPSSPRQYSYLQQAWDAGDEWNHPNTLYRRDWLKGSYCFYWNYTGLLEGQDELFVGPKSTYDSRRECSRLLMSCYLGYDCFRSLGAFGSCERFERASVTPEHIISSAYWSRLKTGSFDLDNINLGLHATYVDGHTETYKPCDTVPMLIIKSCYTNSSYEFGPGTYYIPRSALR
jgi:prepilin-type N-terminal cleavage/methylation domain-containing protein